jgi:hypothetical protein
MATAGPHRIGNLGDGLNLDAVDAHGGTIEVTSSDVEDTTHWVRPPHTEQASRASVGFCYPKVT